jgi:hypothetical protein
MLMQTIQSLAEILNPLQRLLFGRQPLAAL